MKKLSGIIMGATIIITLFIISSCHKNENNMSDNLNAEKSGFINPKENVGLLHNEILEYTLSSITELPSDGNYKSFVEGIISREYGPVSLSSIPNFPENLDIYSWLNSFNISTELKNEIKKTFALFESEPTLVELIAEIEEREVLASTLFTGEELNRYYEHLAVAKHTAIFWYPVSQGGLNGIQYINISSLKSTQAIDWWKVFGADCCGGIMTGTPIGYAGASAIAIIMLY